jgi:hypothetical protein
LIKPADECGPAASEGIHRLVKIVRVARFFIVQPTGLGEHRAASGIGQSQLGVGKKQAGKNHGLQAGRDLRREAGKEICQAQVRPSIAQQRAATEVERLSQARERRD